VREGGGKRKQDKGEYSLFSQVVVCTSEFMETPALELEASYSLPEARWPEVAEIRATRRFYCEIGMEHPPVCVGHARDPTACVAACSQNMEFRQASRQRIAVPGDETGPTQHPPPRIARQCAPVAGQASGHERLRRAPAMRASRHCRARPCACGRNTASASSGAGGFRPECAVQRKGRRWRLLPKFAALPAQFH